MRKMKNSGFDLIGEIPSDWMTNKIKFVADFYNGDRGKNYPSGEDLVDDGIVFLTSNNIHSTVLDTKPEITKYISPERYKILGGAKIEKGDLIFCLRGSVGLCSINETEDEGTVASSLTVIRPHNINNRYINYVLNSPVAQIQTKVFENGSCAANLSAENVSTYIIPFPPLAEQKKIADFLDEKCGEIDSIKADVQRQIELLNDYKKSVITEAVTKGLNSKAKLKDSGIEWIGKIPDHWGVKRFKYVADALYKGNGITKEQVFFDGNTQCVRYGEIYSKYNISFSDCLSLTKSELISSPQYFEHGDILFAGTGELVEEIGKNIVYLGNERCLAGGDIVVARHSQNPSFLNYALGSSYCQSQKSSGKAKLKVVHISAAQIGNILVALPPLSEQKEIADYLDEKCSEIDAVIADKQKQLETLDEYKKSLIFEYVTGKKEVVQ